MQENKEYIKQIDAYLSGNMNDAEEKQFIEKCNANPDLKNLLKEFELTFQALNRNWVQKSWKHAAKKMLLFKIAATAIIALGISVIGIISYNHLSNSNAKTNQSHISDKQSSQVALSQKKDSLKNDSIPQLAETKNTQPNQPFVCGAKQTKPNILKVHKTEPSTLGANTAHLTTQQSIEEEFKSLQSLQYDPLIEAQNFEISAQEDIVITGKKGLKVAIPANVFIDSARNAVQGIISLKLKEYLSPYALFEQGIGTNSTEGLLASGGSCYLMAYQNGKELQVDPSKTIALEFPGKHHPNMTSYLGAKNDSGVNWTAGISQPKFIVYEKAPLKELPKRVIDNKEERIFSDAPIVDRSQLFCFNLQALKQKNEDLLLQKMITDSNENKAVYNYFDNIRHANKEWAYKLFQEKEKNLVSDTFEIHYKISADGMLYKYTIGKTKSKKHKRKLKRIAKSQGRLLLDKDWKYGEYDFTLRLFSCINYSSQERSKIKTDSMLQDEHELNKVLSNTIRTNKLGYINCDRLTSSARTKFISFRSTNPNGYMYIHIPRVNGLLRQGANTDVRLIPNEKVNVIYIQPSATGIQMSVLKNINAKGTIQVDQHMTIFDKNIIKNTLQ